MATRQLRVEIVGDPRRILRTFDSIERSTGKMARGISRFGSLAAAGIAGIAGGAVVAGLKSTIDAASDLNESVSKSRVVFGKSNKAVQDFAKGASRSLGQSRQQAIEAAATFGNLFVSMKLGQKPAADMSIKIVRLASDLASFNNVKPEEALEALRAGLVGETEPLRRFGINLNDATLRQEALALGLTKTTKEVLPPAVKAQAAYSLIMKQSATAQGDFARTAGGAANQQRIFAARMQDLKASIGQVLLPAFNAGIKVINEGFIPAVERFWKRHGPAFGDAVSDVARKVGVFVGEFRNNLGPQLERVERAWNANKTAILGFLGSLTGGQSKVVSAEDAARSLGDALERLIAFLGTAARRGDDLGNILNRTKDKTQDWGHEVHTAGGFLEGLKRIVKDAWDKTFGLDRATRSAANAAQSHADALLAEKQAIDVLRGALDEEKGAELDLRQAKINVQGAQSRLNDLKKAGRTKSLEYRQAQLDLERAQLNLKEQTQKYRDAQQKANLAASDARMAAGNAAGAYRRLADESFGARKQLVRFALESADAIAKLKNKSLSVTAQFDIGAPRGINLLIEKGLVRHRGGPIPGDGRRDVPAMLQAGEHVWSGGEVTAAGGHGAMERWRAAVRRGDVPELHSGGGVDLRLGMPGAAAFKAQPRRFDHNVGLAMDAAARGFGRWASTFAAFPPHAPGGWQVATQFLRSLGIDYNVISTFRPGARTHASGSVSFHALNRAVDLTGNMMAIFNALSRTNPTELIFSHASRYKSRSGWHPIGQLDPITFMDHLSHVHAAYDRGGWLPPGVSVAVNRTGRPERVLAPGEGGITVNFHGPVYGDKRALTEVVRQGIREALRREGKPVTV